LIGRNKAVLETSTEQTDRSSHEESIKDWSDFFRIVAKISSVEEKERKKERRKSRFESDFETRPESAKYLSKLN